VNRVLVCCLCLAAVAEAYGDDEYFSLTPEFETAVRGQSPDYGGTPFYNPFAPVAPQDPFLTPGMPYQPTQPMQPGPPVFSPSFGVNWAQPYRTGWTPRMDMAYLPSSHTSPDVGNFSIFELDTELVHVEPLNPDLLFTVAPQFSYRNWDATSTFNDNLFHFGLGLQLATPVTAPVGFQLTFDPSVNTDFDSNITRDAFNLDANGTLFFRVNTQLTVVLGAGYLDRVKNIVIPYAGVVYTPDELWEFRLLFPQGRISRYVGHFVDAENWMYLAWEYHVESYEVNLPSFGQNQIQMEDYRVTVGLRSDHPQFTKYIEAGYVFGRNVDFRTGPGFDISDGFIVRGGIRF